MLPIWTSSDLYRSFLSSDVVDGKSLSWTVRCTLSGETSTVHGVTLFRVKSLCLTRSTILGSSLLTLESGVNRTMKMTSSPATSSPTPIYDSMLSSRRSGTFIRTCAWKIGFSLVDLFSKCGPSVNSWPITRCNGFNQQIAKPRSVLSFSQLSPTHRLSRFLSLCGQGLHGSWKSVSMFWLCFYHHRTLNMLAILSTNPKKLTTLNTSTNQSKSPQSEVASAIRGITLILRFSKLLLDLISLPNPSFSPLEHQWYNPLLLSEKAIIPSSRVERTLDTTFSLQLPGLKPCKQSILLTFVILRVKLFAPARTKVLDLESSSTSLCLMTVTNFSPPGLLVEVCSTRHVSAYSNWLVSLGLQACMDLKLNYPTYPLAALGNAPFLNVLNFEISSTLYLEPVCLDE
ncbi:unnamed protein product [Arabidopsis halleri]